MTQNKIEELAMEKAVRWHMAYYDLKGRTYTEYVSDMSWDKVDFEGDDDGAWEPFEMWDAEDLADSIGNLQADYLEFYEQAKESECPFQERERPGIPDSESVGTEQEIPFLNGIAQEISRIEEVFYEHVLLEDFDIQSDLIANYAKVEAYMVILHFYRDNPEAQNLLRKLDDLHDNLYEFV